MVDFTNVMIEKLVIHIVGNKANEEGFSLSDKEIILDNDITKDLIANYFFNSFKSDLIYSFDDLDENVVYNLAGSIFSDISKLYESSVDIVKHLYDNSMDSKIKLGELFVTYIPDIFIGDERVDALGIFKTENKDYFLRVDENNNEFSVNYSMGANINKLDKGCIIFNTDVEEGYKIAIVDRNSSSKASYWSNDFLGLKIFNNEFTKTRAVMSMCKSFANEIFEEDAKEKVILLNDSFNYFDNNSRFNVDDFANEVISNPGYVHRFKEYMNEPERYDLGIDNFDISENAVKKMKRSLKSHIKLDTEIEIKLNSQNDSIAKFVEKGYDEDKGMKYYKVYFNKEE